MGGLKICERVLVLTPEQWEAMKRQHEETLEWVEGEPREMWGDQCRLS